MERETLNPHSPPAAIPRQGLSSDAQAPGLGAGGRKKRAAALRSRHTRRQSYLGYVFIAPWLIGFTAFSLAPLVAIFYLGFTSYPIIGAPRFIGIANYVRLFTSDPLFGRALYNTVFYVGLRVPLLQLAALSAALLLNRDLKFHGFFRAGLYLPVMVPVVARAVIWRFLLGRVGIINYFLFWLGLPTINLLSSTTWIKPVFVAFSLWELGVPMIIYLAGLHAIPRHLYESADIDGASSFQKLVRITIPMLTPVILLNVVMDIIKSFQVFAPAWIMTEGGPVNSSLFYVLHIFKSGFVQYRMGYASALASVLFLIVLVFTVVFIKSSDNWVHYDQV